jgi:hypothetical protein
MRCGSQRRPGRGLVSGCAAVICSSISTFWNSPRRLHALYECSPPASLYELSLLHILRFTARRLDYPVKPCEKLVTGARHHYLLNFHGSMVSWFHCAINKHLLSHNVQEGAEKAPQYDRHPLYTSSHPVRHLLIAHNVCTCMPPCPTSRSSILISSSPWPP